MHGWWNRKTRKAKDLVPVSGVRVQVPPRVPTMIYAQVVELVDTPASGAGAERHAGSIPVLCTRICVFSSDGQSVGLRIRRSQVQALEGVPVCARGGIGRRVGLKNRHPSDI